MRSTVSRGSSCGATRSAIAHKVSPGSTLTYAVAGPEDVDDACTNAPRPQLSATSARTAATTSTSAFPRPVRRTGAVISCGRRRGRGATASVLIGGLQLLVQAFDRT